MSSSTAIDRLAVDLIVAALIGVSAYLMCRPPFFVLVTKNGAIAAVREYDEVLRSIQTGVRN